jgi:class 3 adenylate cyclase/tetratricopeptide (TPR) repeat protein
MSESLGRYLPQDRLRALVQGVPLPERTIGAVLFADISGFTPLTEALSAALGPRRGAETLTHSLDAVYTALIVEVERFGGSVIGFAGDAITCWFDARDGAASVRAWGCAVAMQQAMTTCAASPDAHGLATDLALKVAVTSGPVRRLAVGDPTTQLIDTLVGSTVARAAVGDHLAYRGEVLADEATVQSLGSPPVTEWRRDPATGAHFAKLAGTPLPSDPPAPTPAVSPVPDALIRPWVNGTLYARERSGQRAFLAEFRPATTLFVRFAGIDYDTDEAGPRLDTFIRRAQGILASYGSMILQLVIGDKGSYFYAAFGAPIAHEDDAARAIKAALALRSAARELEFLAPLQIGISCGPLWAGTYGGALRRTYGVLGDEVNLAAGLMAKAAPGEILISRRVQLLSGMTCHAEPQPPLAVKGRTKPLPVFRLIGLAERRATRLQEPTYVLPMVGRHAELQTVTTAIGRVLQGHSQVVAIAAEAGMGKSRLVAEVIRAARRSGLMGYGGAGQSDGVTTPYLAWRPIWSAFFTVDPELALPKQIRHLMGELEDRAVHRVDALPLLGLVLNLPFTDNTFTGTLGPQDRKRVLHALLEDCLRADVCATPTLLVLEDCHWIDALSLDLLEELARAMTSLPVLFVVTYRPSQLPRRVATRLEALPDFTQITLGELAPAECEQVISGRLAQLYPARGTSVPPLLTERLASRAQGNPFYLEELLNYLHDRGLNPYNPADIEQIALPESLHTLILSRIDQLTAGERTALRVASIIGRQFRASWLTGYYPALGALARVAPILDELASMELIRLEHAELAQTYLFKHIVIHEVAYESLPYGTRAKLHEQLAAFLETHELAAAYTEMSLLDLLAFHYGRSDNRAKQIEYLRRAGDAAQAVFANESAVAHYTRILPLVEDPAEQVDLLLQLGEVLTLTGQWEQAEAHYHEALSYAIEGGDLARAARCQQGLAGMCRLHGAYGSALEWLGQACTGWAMAEDAVGLGSALTLIGAVYIDQGAYAAAQPYLEEAAAIGRATGDRCGLARALGACGDAAWYQGDNGAAQVAYADSLALYRETGEKRFWQLISLGLVEIAQGNLAKARAHHEESLALAQEMGYKQGVAWSLLNIASDTLADQDFAKARIIAEESLALSRALGDLRGSIWALLHLAATAYEAGDMGGAQILFIECLQLSGEMRQLTLLGIIGTAAVAVGVGDHGRAARLAGAVEALRIAIWVGPFPHPYVGHVHSRTVAAVWSALGASQFATAWAEGQTLSLEAAIALAATPLREAQP